MNQNYPEYILKRLKDRYDMDYEDTARDEEFQNMSPREVLEEILDYEGICGYTTMILSLIEDIYKVKLDTNCRRFSKQNFVQGLGNIFAAQDNMAEVTAMRMDEDDQVTVFFRGGGTHHANCAMDSKIATIYDIIRQAL